MAEIGQNRPILLFIPSDNICPPKTHLITDWGKLTEFQCGAWHMESSKKCFLSCSPLPSTFFALCSHPCHLPHYDYGLNSFNFSQLKAYLFGIPFLV